MDHDLCDALMGHQTVVRDGLAKSRMLTWWTHCDRRLHKHLPDWLGWWKPRIPMFIHISPFLFHGKYCVFCLILATVPTWKIFGASCIHGSDHQINGSMDTLTHLQNGSSIGLMVQDTKHNLMHQLWRNIYISKSTPSMYGTKSEWGATGPLQSFQQPYMDHRVHCFISFTAKGPEDLCGPTNSTWLEEPMFRLGWVP